MEKKIPFYIAIIPIIITVSLLIITAMFLSVPLYIPLLIGYVLTFIIALKYKIKVIKLIKASFEGIKSISNIFLILLLIGVLIALWTSSGTIDALVYFGLAIINPKFLVLISFWVSMIISMILGTSVGTASTIGIALMGMANSLGASPYMIAGAIVSGAFVGDRTSPLSSAANINTVVTNTNYYENIRGLVKTLLPVIIITSFIYLFVGEVTNIIPNGAESIILFSRKNIEQIYGNISPWLLLPSLSIVLLAIFKVPVKINLLIGSLIGAILAYIFQDRTILDLIHYSIYGFQHVNGTVFGGAWKMFFQVILIIVTGAFFGLMESSGVLEVILDRITSQLTDKMSIIRKTMLISISSALLSSTQLMSILIPGKVMSKFYTKYNMDLKLLNRSISDSGMVVSGLIPWNLNAILLGIALQVKVVDYLPYAFLLMILPIYSYIISKWENISEEKYSRRNLAKNHE